LAARRFWLFFPMDNSLAVRADRCGEPARLCRHSAGWRRADGRCDLHDSGPQRDRRPNDRLHAKRKLPADLGATLRLHDERIPARKCCEVGWGPLSDD
jgi:hypothetical protein